MSEQKRLTRSATDRMVGGVAGGLARYFSVDPVYVRLVFVVLSLFNFIGVLIYFIMWLVVPGEQDLEVTGETMVRSNLNDMKAQAKRFTGSMRNTHGPVFLGLILVGGGLWLLARTIFPAIPAGVFWPGMLIALGLYLLATRR